MERLGAMAIIAACVAGCVAGDERPEPGSVLLNVKRSEPAIDGFVTDDGWTVRLDRLVVGLANVPLDDGAGDCVDYSLTFYERLFDFAVADTSKLGLHYGLGSCEMAFGLAAPSERAILMTGVTEADRELMNPDQDGPFEQDKSTRTALVVRGSAERLGVRKRFDWLIRREHVINRCYAPGSDEIVSQIELGSGDALVRDLEIRPQELFRVTPSLEAEIEFGRFAAADLDSDGAITLEELDWIAVPTDAIVDDLLDELRDLPREELEALLGKATLRTLVHDILSRRVAALSNAGECGGEIKELEEDDESP